MAPGLYFHIPYCFQKCRYCNFYSLGRSRSVPDEYVDALLRELRRFSPGRPATVYFGGGTPSLLTPAQADRLLRAADPLPGAEVTLEANPGTVDAKKLRAFRAAGINRLSLGIQTARDDSLRRLGRIHTAEDSRKTLFDAHEAGFDNISGDVMLALPFYSVAELTETLDLLCEGGVSHISCYLLKLEPGTPFGRHPPDGLPTEDEAADFYLACAAECAQRGFAQYEISNFSLPGRESRHNLIYWNCGDYLGLGPAAHSCLDGRRFFYPPDAGSFIAGTPVQPEGNCTAEDFLMLQLRLAKGLSLTELGRWGRVLSPAQLGFLHRCEREGLAVLTDDRVCLTPRGMLVQNSILCELL